MNHVLMVLSLFMTISCFKGDDDCAPSHQNKVNGLSWVSSNMVVDASHIQPVVDVHANYTALIPFAFMPELNSTEIQYNVSQQWWGETEEGIRKTAQLLADRNVKRLLKPQIWVLGGKFVGFINMDSESDWETFEASYRDYILFYANIAEDEDIEMFCIGTEMKTMVLERPDFWVKLIEDVKKVYHGKLTYAANWDSYMNPKFWKQLDYIGIDAYFPLSDQKTPTVEELENAWNPIAKDIEHISKKEGKSVLFTEFGYRSVDYTALEPWEGNHNTVNHQAQINALQALFNTFWDESWFKGGFLWKWYDNHSTAGGEDNTRFTIQNKPAEEVVSQWYLDHQ